MKEPKLRYLDKLCQFIREHDGCTVAAVEGKQLIVQSEAVIDGRVRLVTESIPATLQAVRDWLGY